MWIGVCVWGIEVKLCDEVEKENEQEKEAAKRKKGEENNVKTMENSEEQVALRKSFIFRVYYIHSKMKFVRFEWRNGEKNRTHSFYEWKTNLMMQNEHTWLTDINWFGFPFVCMRAKANALCVCVYTPSCGVCIKRVNVLKMRAGLLLFFPTFRIQVYVYVKMKKKKKKKCEIDITRTMNTGTGIEKPIVDFFL